MMLVPALDLLDKKIVRLYQGNFDSVTQYDAKVVDTIRAYEDAGVQRIHIVDLNATRGDAQINWKVINSICKSVTTCTIEVGGGVRKDEDVERLIDAGVGRIIVGTALVTTPNRVAQWVQRYGPIFIAGIDVHNDKAFTHGWKQPSSYGSRELARQAQNIGITSIIYTIIEKDGTMSGPAIADGNALAAEVTIPIILSGGVGTINDLQELAQSRHANVKGVIIGKSVYEGTVDLREACALFPQDEYADVLW